MANSRTFNFRVEGADQLVAQLNQIDKHMRGQVAREAVQAGCKIIQEEAKLLAPVYAGAGNRSYYKYGRKRGTLAKSIKVKMFPLTSWGATGAILVTDNLGHLLEYGHKTRLGKKLHRNFFSRFRKGRHKAGGKAFVSPQPYMRPAIDTKQTEVYQEMSRIIQKGMGLR